MELRSVQVIGLHNRRYQVLTKTPKSKEIADTDVLAFNNKFTDRQRKIKMSLLVTKVFCVGAHECMNVV